MRHLWKRDGGRTRYIIHSPLVTTTHPFELDFWQPTQEICKLDSQVKFVVNPKLREWEFLHCSFKTHLNYISFDLWYTRRYVDHETGELIPKEDIDPHAGLYILDRTGTVTKIDIPEDCMLVQIGECLQIVTGGCVVATPHCVSTRTGWYCFPNDIFHVVESMSWHYFGGRGRFEEPIPISATREAL